ncbi:MAG: DUF6358 family protein [Sphingobacteriaceae bacterium]
MILKVLLNVFLNLGIIVLTLSAYWAAKGHHYGFTAAAIFSMALLIFFKARLIKNVKEQSKKK